MVRGRAPGAWPVGGLHLSSVAAMGKAEAAAKGRAKLEAFKAKKASKGKPPGGQTPGGGDDGGAPAAREPDPPAPPPPPHRPPPAPPPPPVAEAKPPTTARTRARSCVEHRTRVRRDPSVRAGRHGAAAAAASSARVQTAPARVHLSPRCLPSHRAKTTATAPGHRTHWHREMHPLIHSSPRRQSLLRQSRRRSPRTLNYPTRTTEHTNRRRRPTRTSTPHSAASPSADPAGHQRWGPKDKTVRAVTRVEEADTAEEMMARATEATAKARAAAKAKADETRRAARAAAGMGGTGGI